MKINLRNLALAIILTFLISLESRYAGLWTVSGALINAIVLVVAYATMQLIDHLVSKPK